jgi:hypothetical protein
LPLPAQDFAPAHWWGQYSQKTLDRERRFLAGMPALTLAPCCVLRVFA